MHTHTDIQGGNDPHPPRITIRALVAVFALAALLTTVGCKKKADGDDHGAAKPAAAGHAQGDGHDHGKGGEEVHTDEVKLTADAVERYGIKIEAAQMWALRPTIVTPARVGFNAEAMAHVGSPLRGRVVEIKVRLGQDVKKGEELCIIESPELGEAQADLLQKRVAKDSAGPVVDLAKASWDRAKGLYDQTQGTSLTEVQRREAEYKGAVAAQRAADAAVTASENRLHLLGMNQAAVDAFLKTGEVAPRYSIHAAIDGQVVQREVTLGELVSPDREAIMVLADLSNVWVLADVPEAKLAAIEDGLYEPSFKQRLADLRAEEVELLRADTDDVAASLFTLLGHPKLAEAYRRKVEGLEAALDGPEALEARERIRSMIAGVELTPRSGNDLSAVLTGELASILALSAEAGGSPDNAKRPVLWARGVGRIWLRGPDLN